VLLLTALTDTNKKAIRKRDGFGAAVLIHCCFLFAFRKIIAEEEAGKL